jgi:hypothetical protein
LVSTAKQAIAQINVALSKKDFAEADLDGDGQLTQEEFNKLVERKTSTTTLL